MDFFKKTRNVDYYALPAHTNQSIMSEVFEAWKAFFRSRKDYSKYPEKYKGKPGLPRYAKKGGSKTITFSNQTCVIKEGRYLKLPKTKQLLNIGKLGTLGRLKEVKAVPTGRHYTIQLVMQIPATEKRELDRSNIIGIDLGVNNFAAIAHNLGLRPLIIKVIKSINQYYNKRRAHFYGILRQGKSPGQGRYSSRRLEHLDSKRNDRIRDIMHKISRRIVDYCVENDIGTMIIGKNKGFKENIKLRSNDKQAFACIPYAFFISCIKYKAEACGITLIIKEESYTSKASFIDRDTLPVYGSMEKNDEFSGKRISRGSYRSKNGTILNADCNASGNIIRKAVPDAFVGRGDRGVVDTPYMLSIV